MYEIIEDVKQREELVNRVEVLHKVGSLLLLPNMEVATTKQVAEFYGVDQSTLREVTKTHNDELKSDGMSLGKFSHVKEIVKSDTKTLLSYGVSYRGTNLFPKRAILRIGMLLRDSEVAKEVRTQLLNIEEKTSTDVKIEDTITELELQMKLAKTVTLGDVAEVKRLHEEIYTYQNRYIAVLNERIQELQPKADKWDDFLSSEGLITFTTLGNKFLGGVSSQNVRKKLQDKGVISKQKIDGTYQPTQKYKSYFEVVTYVNKNNDSIKHYLKIRTEAVDCICCLLKEA